jgi:glucose-6-phosphate isomerase
MKISKSISFKGFELKDSKKKILKIFKRTINEESEIFKSLKKSYKNSYNTNVTKKLKNYSRINLIGMGGSSLGARSIYSFLIDKIKKKFIFFDNLSSTKLSNESNKKKNLNIIISKSGNTLETITNVNFLIKKGQKNIFITENKNSYLNNLAQKLKAEIISHNNYIGGRYSVLSEVGMLPADLMGLDHKKFRQFNNLIKNKLFVQSLITNVSNILSFIKRKKTNSVILNYDENSSDLFSWYQQLVAESLGKKNKGLFPIVSSMPKDNHSLMQLYLSGPQNNFFTFFFVKENFSPKINNNKLLKNFGYLKNKSLKDIRFAQFNATQSVFAKKNIPFRSFLIEKRDEKTLGELFTFFILETILIAKAMNINPYDQPAVELIKNETKKIFIKN